MLNWSWMGKCSISEALALQEHLVLNKQSHILFAEHYPIYTCPERKLSPDLWRTSPSAREIENVVRLDHGGSITYHGPGQIVCYCILNLNEFDIESPFALNTILDNTVKTCLKELGIAGRKRKKPTAAQGIWVTGEDHKMRKIASRGLKISGSMTRFGFALNLATDISYFDKIYPCGVDIEITSVLRESHQLIHPFQAASPLARHFGEALGVTMRAYPHTLLVN